MYLTRGQPSNVWSVEAADEPSDLELQLGAEKAPLLQPKPSEAQGVRLGNDRLGPVGDVFVSLSVSFISGRFTRSK